MRLKVDFGQKLTNKPKFVVHRLDGQSGLGQLSSGIGVVDEGFHVLLFKGFMSYKLGVRGERSGPSSCKKPKPARYLEPKNYLRSKPPCNDF